MLGETADQLHRVVPGAVLLELAGDSERHAELGPRAAFPLHLHVGAALVVLGGDDRLANQRAQQVRAIAIGR
jgi:hypothetical protein